MILKLYSIIKKLLKASFIIAAKYIIHWMLAGVWPVVEKKELIA